MSTVLRASGKTFDVDAFLAECDWEVVKVFKLGAPVRASKPDGPANQFFGFNAAVADAAFGDMEKQIEQATRFLTAEREEVIRLVHFEGVEGVSVDFTVKWRPVAAQGESLPPKLIKAAGDCGIGIDITIYGFDE